ncbi:hypothetical protein NUW58_g1903 [Xylaria curta]|uniref:Uncharacterized protein n=1 Tax=Xylaria curta TaxID=42375 RepID=A0ACC1PJS1_9PEZI|nr:hypothetical protein NUW58_g1903 [Xylaria curta]
MSKIRHRIAAEGGYDKDTAFPAKWEVVLPKAPSMHRSFKTLTWEEIEPWQKNNRFILRGYRPPTNSYTKSLQSVGRLHNQTVNIWSHLLAAIVFAATAAALRQQKGFGTSFDMLLFGQFYAGLVLCLLFSSAFHTFDNHSDNVAHSFFLCDLAGIIMLIVASFYPGVYYGFYCEPSTTRVYWTMITVFGAGAMVVCLAPKFHGDSWHQVRTAMLILLGLSGVFPMTHAAIQFSIPQTRLQMGWDWYVGEAIFYLSGASIYSVTPPPRHGLLTGLTAVR